MCSEDSEAFKRLAAYNAEVRSWSTIVNVLYLKQDVFPVSLLEEIACLTESFTRYAMRRANIAIFLTLDCFPPMGPTPQ